MSSRSLLIFLPFRDGDGRIGTDRPLRSRSYKPVTQAGPEVVPMQSK
jgi:hypothetical protein